MTEEWFYASLSVQHWVDSAPYMHEHYTVQQLSRGIGKPQRTFLKLKFFVGMSTNPSQIFLETILSAAGGSIADTIQGAEYLIFGESNCTVLYCTVLYCTVVHCTVLLYSVSRCLVLC